MERSEKAKIQNKFQNSKRIKIPERVKMQNHEKNLEKAKITEFDFFASILNTVDYLTLKTHLPSLLL